jgi:hypothetical protein
MLHSLSPTPERVSFPKNLFCYISDQLEGFNPAPFLWYLLFRVVLNIPYVLPYLAYTRQKLF